jgi:hypothetical protein
MFDAMDRVTELANQYRPYLTDDMKAILKEHAANLLALADGYVERQIAGILTGIPDNNSAGLFAIAFVMGYCAASHHDPLADAGTKMLNDIEDEK